MKRILLEIEYDGTNYSGWQKQPGQKTIQGEIENAIKNSIGEDVEVYGSGRTDAGVHALGQCAHFDLTLPVPVDKIAFILNNSLPNDIVIKKACEVDKNFHARFSIKKKCYLYKIYQGEKNAFLANRVCFIRKKLDIDKMILASKVIEGKHDFRGFCAAATSAQDFVRELFSIEILKEGDYIEIRVCGNGFLYNMVRIIVGTLVDFALGELSIDDIKYAISHGDRTKAGRTMPAQGLYLERAIY